MESARVPSIGAILTAYTFEQHAVPSCKDACHSVVRGLGLPAGTPYYAARLLPVHENEPVEGQMVCVLRDPGEASHTTT